jgi:hypothetical protein
MWEIVTSMDLVDTITQIDKLSLLAVDMRCKIAWCMVDQKVPMTNRQMHLRKCALRVHTICMVHMRNSIPSFHRRVVAIILTSPSLILYSSS